MAKCFEPDLRVWLASVLSIFIDAIILVIMAHTISQAIYLILPLCSAHTAFSLSTDPCSTISKLNLRLSTYLFHVYRSILAVPPGSCTSAAFSVSTIASILIRPVIFHTVTIMILLKI